VTRRAWKILVLGLVVIAGLGGFAASQGRSSSSPEIAPSWGLYAPRQWNAVTSRFARRGFARDSVRVVTGTRLADGHPFALIGARSNAGRTCFAVARGGVLGAAICRFSKPVTVFTARDTCAPCSPAGRPLDTRSLLALVRADVTVTMVHDGRESGVGLVPAGTGFALNSAFIRSADRLRARDASGHVLASISFPSS
jgi:hypothetical protein